MSYAKMEYKLILPHLSLMLALSSSHSENLVRAPEVPAVYRPARPSDDTRSLEGRQDFARAIGIEAFSSPIALGSDRSTHWALGRGRMSGPSTTEKLFDFARTAGVEKSGSFPETGLWRSRMSYRSSFVKRDRSDCSPGGVAGRVFDRR